MTETTPTADQPERYRCPVCLWKVFKRDPMDGKVVLCLCCGTEFGSAKYTRIGEDLYYTPFRELRERWLASGGKWYYEDRQPIPEFIEGQLGRYE